MQRATHPVEEHHPAEPAAQPAAQPIPRDPDLPTVSDTTLMFFAAGALVVTLVALLVLF
jgi:hypothetical protein